MFVVDANVQMLRSVSQRRCSIFFSYFGGAIFFVLGNRAKIDGRTQRVGKGGLNSPFLTYNHLYSSVVVHVPCIMNLIHVNQKRCSHFAKVEQNFTTTTDDHLDCFFCLCCCFFCAASSIINHHLKLLSLSVIITLFKTHICLRCCTQICYFRKHFLIIKAFQRVRAKYIHSILLAG